MCIRDRYQEKLYELRTKAHDYSRFNEQIGKRAKTKADYEKAKASLDEYLSPVSYTHLDVYKRQAHPDASFGSPRYAGFNYGGCALRLRSGMCV